MNRIRDLIAGIVKQFIDNVFPHSIQDDIRFRLTLIDDDSDLERARRVILKYDGIIPDKSVLSDKVFDLRDDASISIFRKDDKYYMKIRQDDEIENKFSLLRGHGWTLPYHVFPPENVVVPILLVERKFGVFIDEVVPEACFAAINIYPENKEIRVAVFVDHPQLYDFINAFSFTFDNRTSTYIIKINTIDDLQRAIIGMSSKDFRIVRFLKKSAEKISKLKEILVKEALDRKEIKSLSSAGTTRKIIRFPEGLTPYPFQIVGVEFIEKTGARALVADEMGLGKTIIASLFLYNHPEISPVIVVVPESVKVNWKREVKKWAAMEYENIQLIHGTVEDEENKILPGKKVYIINYNIISSRVSGLEGLHARLIVLDEAHLIKNHKAKRTQSIFYLSDHVPNVICLTGTPVINKPIDLWSIIKITKNEANFGGFWGYAIRYCNAQETPWGWKMDGISNSDELQAKLRETLMIRRLKRDVMPELPPKRRMLVPISITNRASYEKAATHFRDWCVEKDIKNAGRAEAMVRIEKLKQMAFKGKAKSIVEFIEDTCENVEKVVVFFSHRDALSKIRDELKKYNRGFTLDELISDDPAEKRQEICDYFNDHARAILLCSIKACNCGINLQTCNTVIFAEFEWTSTMHMQAEDRTHRIGQEKEVNVYYLFAENTVEEEIVTLLNKKQEMIGDSVGLDDDVTGEFLSGIVPLRV